MYAAKHALPALARASCRKFRRSLASGQGRPPSAQV